MRVQAVNQCLSSLLNEMKLNSPQTVNRWKILCIWTRRGHYAPVAPDGSLPYKVGKLGKKQEPAGKVFVFAMMDAVRQRVLHPFHEWCMDLLKELPTDGTFDQLRPRLLLSFPFLKTPKILVFWCFDLTSATDRMPLGVYHRFWGLERNYRVFSALC